VLNTVSTSTAGFSTKAGGILIRPTFPQIHCSAPAALYFVQGRPSSHGKAAHGFTPSRSVVRDAGRVGLSLKQEHSSTVGYLIRIKKTASCKTPVAAIDTEPLDWVSAFLAVFARKHLSLWICSPAKPTSGADHAREKSTRSILARSRPRLHIPIARGIGIAIGASFCAS